MPENNLIKIDFENFLSFSEFESFTSLVSEDFNPPFLSYVNLFEYYNKIIKYGKMAVCRIDNNIAGLLLFYCNDIKEKKSYFSFLAINPNYRKRGIAKKIMLETISYVKQKGMNFVNLRTNSSIALKMYLELGFTTTHQEYENKIGLVRYYLEKTL